MHILFLFHTSKTQNQHGKKLILLFFQHEQNNVTSHPKNTRVKKKAGGMVSAKKILHELGLALHSAGSL